MAGASGGKHWGRGVRSVAYSPLPAPSDDNDDNDGDDDDNEIVLLVSMGMDGRVIVWDASWPDAQSIVLD